MRYKNNNFINIKIKTIILIIRIFIYSLSKCTEIKL